ncbi:hypothetical protein [Hydrogenophaga sp.]|uniref:hypothetical protein n=1 Tax=Hydrogenophaga sp. TaxID=1904254 RepID=UPI003F704446
MSKNALIGIAGVHHVVSELSRRGFVALPTTKNLAAFDILASNLDGTRHFNIQVKASLKSVSFFPMPPASKVRAGKDDIYIVVRWIEKEKRFEGFLLTGKQAKKAVEDSCQRQAPSIARGSRAKEFPTIHVGPSQPTPEAKRWQKAWEDWKLNV